MSDAEVNFGDAGGIITQELTDEVREQMVGGKRNLIAATVRRANEVLLQRAASEEWDVEDVAASVNVEVNETSGTSAGAVSAGLSIRIWYEHEAAEFFEFGTSPHTVEGDPLSFVWEERHDPPEWVRENFEADTSEGGRPGYRVFFASADVQGIPEVRYLRSALDWLEREMQRRAGQ